MGPTAPSVHARRSGRPGRVTGRPVPVVSCVLFRHILHAAALSQKPGGAWGPRSGREPCLRPREGHLCGHQHSEPRSRPQGWAVRERWHCTPGAGHSEAGGARAGSSASLGPTCRRRRAGTCCRACCHGRSRGANRKSSESVLGTRRGGERVLEVTASDRGDVSMEHAGDQGAVSVDTQILRSRARGSCHLQVGGP